MAGLTHVHAGEAVRLRAVLQGIQSPVLQESLKWNAPSYAVGGVHVVTFNFGAPKSVRLIFHCDTKRKETKGAPPAMVDETGLLAWYKTLAALTLNSGRAIMVLAMVWGAWLLWRGWRRQRG